MPKKKPEKEPKAAKAKKTKEKPPKASKKKKGKGKDAEEAAAEAQAAAPEETANAEGAEGAEADGKEKKPKKSGRGILDPILCVLIAILAVCEIGMIYLWLTTPSAEEIRAQLESQTVHEPWSTSSYANWHGTYRPSDAPAPVAAYATSDDVPATAQPIEQPGTGTSAPTV